MPNSQEITFSCTECNAKSKKTLSWLKKNKQFTCQCGAIFDTNNVLQEINKLVEVLTTLMRFFPKHSKFDKSSTIFKCDSVPHVFKHLILPALLP